MKYTSKNVFEHPMNKDADFQEAFNDFLDMRKKMKKFPTERAIKLLLLTIIELSKDNAELAVKIIDQSVKVNWLDFYPLKEQEKNTFGSSLGGNRELN